MIVYIPMAVVDKAIAYFDAGIQDPFGGPPGSEPEERIGFFGLKPGYEKSTFKDYPTGVMPDEVMTYSVDWYPTDNVSPFPQTQSEIKAEWLADMIINNGVHPVAMAHSHPSGNPSPSNNLFSEHNPDDFTMFPSMYVDVAFIWTPTHPDSLTQYTATREVHNVQKDQVFVVVQP